MHLGSWKISSVAPVRLSFPAFSLGQPTIASPGCHLLAKERNEQGPLGVGCRHPGCQLQLQRNLPDHCRQDTADHDSNRQHLPKASNRGKARFPLLLRFLLNLSIYVVPGFCLGVSTPMHAWGHSYPCSLLLFCVLFHHTVGQTKWKSI